MGRQLRLLLLLATVTLCCSSRSRIRERKLTGGDYPSVEEQKQLEPKHHAQIVISHVKERIKQLDKKKATRHLDVEIPVWHMQQAGKTPPAPAPAPAPVDDGIWGHGDDCYARRPWRIGDVARLTRKRLGILGMSPPTLEVETGQLEAAVAVAARLKNMQNAPIAGWDAMTQSQQKEALAARKREAMQQVALGVKHLEAARDAMPSAHDERVDLLKKIAQTDVNLINRCEETLHFDPEPEGAHDTASDLGPKCTEMFKAVLNNPGTDYELALLRSERQDFIEEACGWMVKRLRESAVRNYGDADTVARMIAEVDSGVPSFLQVGEAVADHVAGEEPPSSVSGLEELNTPGEIVQWQENPDDVEAKVGNTTPFKGAVLPPGGEGKSGDTPVATSQIACAIMRYALTGVKELAEHRLKLKVYDCASLGEKEACSGMVIGYCQKPSKHKCDIEAGIQGVCMCRTGNTGISCAQRTCPKSCGKHGYCASGSCHCLEGWAGKYCTEMDCEIVDDVQCSGHGECRTDEAPVAPGSKFTMRRCWCEGGWVGQQCDRRLCPFGQESNGEVVQCSGNGRCNSHGTCSCLEGFGGVNCQECTAPGPRECTVAGYSDLSNDVLKSCKCAQGFFGPCCNRIGCPDNCSANGMCDGSTGKCTCDKPFFGHNCSVREPTCPRGPPVLAPNSNNAQTQGEICSGRGQCVPVKPYAELLANAVANKAVAEVEGEKDTDIQVKTEGMCICPPKWSGEACEVEDACPYNCFEDRGRGKCQGSKCRCSNGYGGDGCEKVLPIESHCAHDCGEKCLHLSHSCDWDPSTPGFGETWRDNEESVLQQSTLPTVLLEEGTQDGKETACYWKCLHGCVLDRCLKDNEDDSSKCPEIGAVCAGKAQCVAGCPCPKCKPDFDPTDAGKICCKAATPECSGCAIGVTADEFCRMCQDEGLNETACNSCIATTPKI